MVKKILIVAGIAVAFMLGYGGMAKAYYGQSPGQGYFSGGGNDTSGWEVLNVSCSSSGEYGPYHYSNGDTDCNAIPRDLNSAGEFIAFIQGRLNNGIPNGSYGFSTGTYGDTRARTGAAAIVHTMLGTPLGQRNRPPNGTQWNAWVQLVNDYAGASRVNWSTTSLGNSVCVNSLFQGTDNSPSPNDVTFFNQCRDGPMIVFTAPNGSHYVIRRECGNPMGGVSLPPLQDFNLSGTSTVTSNATPKPGEQVGFSHSVSNGGPTDTSPTSINWWTDDGGGGSATGSTNAGTFGVPGTHTRTESPTVPLNTAPGTLFCRRVVWTPDTQAGGTDASARACATVRYDYTLVPLIGLTVNGAVPTTSPVIAQPGDVLAFSYSVNNTGTTDSPSVSCNIYGLKKNGSYSPPTPYDSTSDAGYVPPATGCPRVFPHNTSGGPSQNTPINTETLAAISAADINKTICRALWVNPSSPGGPATGFEVCVRVGARPYFRAYGGDLSAGGGQGTSCTNNASAAIIGWNRGSGASYSGAGVQFGAMALSTIYDVATSLGNGGGAAPAPSGLALANSGASGSNFGGSFGAASCIANRYNVSGATALSGTDINLSNLAGVNRYSINGPITISGNINPNQRTVLYVNGNVLIDTQHNVAGIQYTGSWNPNSMPLFELVVSNGNIYVSQNVTQIDGQYQAIPSGAVGGNIYTCANPGLPATAAVTTNGASYLACRNKLTINGGLVAKQVQFLRTTGTVQAAQTPSDPSSSANIAEVINYSPALWIAQPPLVGGSAGEYDAITSLPPVL